MANEEVLSPRKTMFTLVIVVGCFAVLWPRMFAPLFLGWRKGIEPNQYDKDAALKQERSTNRGSGPTHPALRERGRAIPPNAPTPPSQGPVPLPAHIRPPPIPGMRPPLGQPGHVTQQRSSTMGVVLPIYTICIILFFVYTLSKVLFKRGDTTYEPLEPSPQFRRRVFRDDSRTTPETKLGDVELEALKARLAETERAMQRIVSQIARREADAPDSNTRPYTNGNVVTDHPQVRIVASEYQEPSRVKLQTIVEPPTPEPKEFIQESKLYNSDLNELSSELKGIVQEPKKLIEETKESTPEREESSPEPKESSPDVDELLSAPDSRDLSPEPKELSPEPQELRREQRELRSESRELSPEPKELSPELMELKTELQKTLEQAANKEDIIRRVTEEFLDELKEDGERKEKKQSTPELIADAVKEESGDNDEVEPDKSTVKVLGMESTAHMSDGGAFPRSESPVHFPTGPRTPQHVPEDVKSIYLETEIPQQSSVLVADFASGRASSPPTAKHSSLVVSGKMTLSLIQDPPRDTPERDLDESTIDDFTTASAYTQPVADEMQNAIIEEDLSEEEIDEEIDEEIEIEEIEEEVTDEEAEDDKQH